MTTLNAAQSGTGHDLARFRFGKAVTAAIRALLRFEMKVRRNGRLGPCGDHFLRLEPFLAKHFLRRGIRGRGCAL
jgi:hypothetical protein